MHTMQVTAHTCSGPAGEHITSCDKGGARRNSWFVNRKGLCPKDDCIIDSRRPFRHVQNFVAANGTLIRIENRLEQGGRVLAFNGTSDSAYLAKMSRVLTDGMVLTFQLWGASWLLMSWCDQRDHPNPQPAAAIAQQLGAHKTLSLRTTRPRTRARACRLDFMTLCTGSCPATSRAVYSNISIASL